MPDTVEEWRPVVGYEGLYSVSNLGRVRSEARRQGARPGAILKSGISGEYPRVALHRKDGGKTRLVHLLVLEAFRGPRPKKEMEACHWDGDKTNNRLDNLRWDTSSANNEDIIRLGRSSQANQVSCKRGHPLRDPNVYWRGRRRACRSCSWEWSRANREGESFRGDLADGNCDRIFQAGLAARHAERELREIENTEKRENN